MQQRDYILRMIEQVGTVLARLRQMILGGGATAEELESELLKTAGTFGVDLDMARVASPDTLAELISIGGTVNPTRCWLTAEILFLDALEKETMDDSRGARLSYEKAQRLFFLLEPGGGFITGWPEASERAAEVASRLENLPGDETVPASVKPES